jgi:deoxyadenosine/deoxycytidine kinase
MHFDKGNMSDVDYETYTHLFEAMVMTPYFPQPDCLIYLEGSLDDILARIQKRGRKMEQETPVSYWEEMYDRYEKWIASFNSCPVLRVNINDYDLRDNPESIDHIVEKIAQKIEAKREVRL